MPTRFKVDGGGSDDNDDDAGVTAGAVVGVLAGLVLIYCGWQYYKTHYEAEPTMQRMGLMSGSDSRY